jgi:EpsI family protein
MSMSPVRTGIAALVILAGIVTTHSLKPKVVLGLQTPLSELPSSIGAWRSVDLPFDSDIVRVAGADDYVNRAYLGSSPPLELYVGYYKNQRLGDKAHSPRNCLIGQGWEPVHSALVQIGTAGNRSLLVNEYLVENNSRHSLVLYWYQTHRRIIASEYAMQFWLVADALQRKTNDGVLIRIWASASDGESGARRSAVAFAHELYPHLENLLPN